ncbi:MAG: hypothetical protein WCY09_09165 [Candidatus Omnitrophota bacterium]
MSKQIEISDEIYEKLKDQLCEGGECKEISSYEDLVGNKFLFRTVTYHYLGEVKKVVGRFVYLKNASWVADTGRFMDFLKNGLQTNTEIEPMGETFVNMDTVVDFSPWKHKLPTDQK